MAAHPICDDSGATDDWGLRWGHLRSPEVKWSLKPAPDRGISVTRLTRGGGLFPPPQNSGATGRIYKLQTAFDRSGKCVRANLMLLTSGSLMTSQARSKSKCLTILSNWIYRALEPYEMEISQYSTWIVSGTLLSIILRFRWTFSRSRSFKVKRSRKGQTENFGFGWRDNCFWVRFSSRTRKSDARTLFEPPKSDKFW